jgi:hypothetical protein
MPETEPRPDARRRPLGRSERALVVLALVVIGAGGLWLWRGRDAPAPAPPPSAEAPAPSGEPAAPPSTDAAPPVAPADARALLEAVSPDPRLRRWVTASDLAERWAAVTDNVARGESPAPHLPFLRPETPFSTAERGGRTVIATASYGRYDAFGDLVASVDAAAFARAYRALHGTLEAAHRALGGPAGSIDRATARALQRILAAPVRDGEVAVVDEGGLFVFEDPALERLGEVDKHLLRMGPRNTRLVQEKAREIGAALGLPAAP